MRTYEVKTKVYHAETGEFIGVSTATIEAETKEDARFFFYHGVILASTPEGRKIIPDMRTLKPCCPKCNSPSPKLHPAMQFEGEVQPCDHDWHKTGGRQPLESVCKDCGHGHEHHFNAGERNICGGGEWNGDLHSDKGCRCDGFKSAVDFNSSAP